MAREPAILSIQVGRIAPLGPDGVPSGFIKREAPAPVVVRRLGIIGDEQADLRVHGGPDKAVYGYSHERYAEWARDFPEHAALFVPGGMGENLTIIGLDEREVCLGDIVRVGSVTLQVSQPRQPCFKFALRFADKRMPRAMIRNGFSGWYYRVLGEGTVDPGSAVTLLERPNPGWPILRLTGLIDRKGGSAAEIAEFVALPGLAAAFRTEARRLSPTLPFG